MDTPIIYPISSSKKEHSIENSHKEEAIILIKGYTTQDDDTPKDHKKWVKAIRRMGFNGTIYHLWWDSSNMDQLIWTATKGVFGVYGFLSFGLFGGVKAARRHWKKIKKRAKRSGRDYVTELILREVTEPVISFTCHSLGARVLYYSLLNYTSYQQDKRINNIFILGGAIGRNRKKNKDWDSIASMIDGNIFNFYSKDDEALSKLYWFMEGHTPVGRKKISSDEIINIKVACDHHGYRKRLKRINAYR